MSESADHASAETPFIPESSVSAMPRAPASQSATAVDFSQATASFVPSGDHAKQAHALLLFASGEPVEWHRADALAEPV